MSLLIQNGTLIGDAEPFVADVRCRDGRIAEVGAGLEAVGEECIDASGAYLLPGGVDPHVHMSLPVAGTVSADDFESGTAAAIAGGTTTIVDFVHPERGQSYVEALEERLREAENAIADYSFHMAITWWDESCTEAVRACVERGVTTFKAYLAYKDAVGIDDADLIPAMAAIADVGGMLLVHCEHGEAVEYLRERFAAAGDLADPANHALSRPAELEGEATSRAITLAETTGAQLYVVHVTCRESLAAIAAARNRGSAVVGETCPHYLLLDDSVYRKPDFASADYVCAPPIRPTGHQDQLWRGIARDVLSVVATDHCPFTHEQRQLGRDDFRKIPGGTPGIEHRMALLYTHGVATGRIELDRWLDLVSTRPAQLFGLYPRKGALHPGSDADLVIWDPDATGTISADTHHHKCDRSIYEAFALKGLPAIVVAGGRVSFRDGNLEVSPGTGRFLHRALPDLGAAS